MSPEEPPSGDGRDHEVPDLSPGKRMENLLGQLREQARNVREAWRAGEESRLRVLVNQLASTAEGTGHRAISEMAADLEQMLLAEEAETSAMCERIEQLIAQCKHAASLER